MTVLEPAESSIGSDYTWRPARVVEWQTQQTQNLPLARACEFDSRPGHQFVGAPEPRRRTILSAMAMRMGIVSRLLIAAGLALPLATIGAPPTVALTQSISIRPTSGSATQRITVTFVGESCGEFTFTDEAMWDGQPFVIFRPDPPSCKYVFTAVPQSGHQGPGKHHICAGAGADTTYFSCATYTILAPRRNPTPKPTPKPAPTLSPSPSPTPSPGATPAAIALVTATPTPAPAPPTSPGATPPPEITTGAGGAAVDLTLVWIGGAIVLGLLVGVVIGAVRRARAGPGRR